MSPSRWFLLLLTATLPIALAFRSQEPALWCGIIKAEGILFPLARYHEGAWSNPWPKPDESLDVSIESVEQIPAAWQGKGDRISPLWYSAAPAAPSPFRILKPAKFVDHCQQSWGLRTDFNPGKEGRAFHSAHGLACNQKEKIVAFSEVAEAGATGAALVAFLQPLFDRAEDQAVTATGPGRLLEGPLRPQGRLVSRVERQRLRPTLARAYRSDTALSDEYLYHVQVQKEYANLPGSSVAGCPVSFFQGWMWGKGDSGFRLLDQELALTDCEFINVRKQHPLGLVSIAGASFVVVQTHGYEDESYLVLRVDRENLRRVLETGGGGC
jgi:hypothetical protein